MYEMSLILEPKESENEKITRLLIESGFIYINQLGNSNNGHKTKLYK